MYKQWFGYIGDEFNRVVVSTVAKILGHFGQISFHGFVLSKT
jgi:hypothetical protein